MTLDKLKDLLKHVDKDTRRCIVLLNNKMDEKFKRVMAVKSTPSPQPPIDVTELRAELRKEIDEVKSYVRSRDKVNKEAIKKFDEDIVALRSYIIDGEERQSRKFKPFREYSPFKIENMSIEKMSERVKTGLANGLKWAIEEEVVTSSDDYLFFHSKFEETLINIHSDDHLWLEYIMTLNSIKWPDLIVPINPLLEFSNELYKIAAAILVCHRKHIDIQLVEEKQFYVNDYVRRILRVYVTNKGKLKLPPEEELSIMGLDRDNWLPLEASFFYGTYSGD